MESVNDIKSALSERSRTATLDELRNEGRKRVRLIRAEHVAQMISEAVTGAIEASGLVDPGEVDRLVEKSREEFKAILREREEELRRAQENEERLEETEEQLGKLRQELDATRQELEAARQQLEAQPTDDAAGAPPAAPAGVPSDMVMTLMQEMATLKASMGQGQAPVAPAAPQGQAQPAAGGGADISAALEKLAGSLNERLESLGRKMGISSAVEGDAPVDFGGLFNDTDSNLESNMENIQVKKKTGGGIAANLAKLKKLKGGG